MNTGSEKQSFSACYPDGEGHCLTCSDEAVEVKVIKVNRETGLALVEIADRGGEEEIDVTLVEQVAVGDILLTHGGVALNRVGTP